MPLITAVQDRLVLDLTELKLLLGLDVDVCTNDALLTLSLSAAKQAADEFLNNPFLERVDLPYNDLVNWDGNRVDASSIDIIVNTDTEVTGQRLSHSLPDRYSDPEVEEAIPNSVKLGVVKWVEVVLSSQGAGSAGPVVREKIGDWERQYAQPSASGGASASNQFDAIRETYWRTYRLVPGF